MLKYLLAAAAAVVACVPAGANITKLRGSFTGTVTSGLYHSDEVVETPPFQPAMPEINQNLAGETFSFDIIYDNTFETFGFEFFVGVSNARSLGGNDVTLQKFVLDQDSLEMEFSLLPGLQNDSASVALFAERNGTTLSNWRGSAFLGGQYFPTTSFWALEAQMQNLSFTGVFDDFTAQVTPVPEPATWAMMIGGFGAAGLVSRNRRQRATKIKGTSTSRT